MKYCGGRHYKATFFVSDIGPRLSNQAELQILL